MGVFAVAGDVDGDESAGALPLEKVVGGFEEFAEFAADEFGDRSVEFGRACEVERATVEEVGAFHVDCSAGD